MMIWILWATRLEITIHSNKRNPFAFQLLYCGTTFASTSLTASKPKWKCWVLLRLGVGCQRRNDQYGHASFSSTKPRSYKYIQQCCCRRSGQYLCWELYLLKLRVIVKFRRKKKILLRLLDSEWEEIVLSSRTLTLYMRITLSRAGSLVFWAEKEKILKIEQFLMYNKSQKLLLLASLGNWLVFLQN